MEEVEEEGKEEGYEKGEEESQGRVRVLAPWGGLWLCDQGTLQSDSS